MHEKVITTEPDICGYVPNDREYAIKKTFMSGALALLVVAYSAPASAQTVADKAAQSDTQTAEASFMAENQAAMSKMMKDMTIKPAGNVDADFTAMMIPHHQGAVAMAKAAQEKLATASQKAGSALYAQQQADAAAAGGPAGGPTDGPGPSSAGAGAGTTGKDDDVVEAEIVDEDDKR